MIPLHEIEKAKLWRQKQISGRLGGSGEMGIQSQCAGRILLES